MNWLPGPQPRQGKQLQGSLWALLLLHSLLEVLTKYQKIEIISSYINHLSITFYLFKFPLHTTITTTTTTTTATTSATATTATTATATATATPTPTPTTPTTPTPTPTPTPTTPTLC